MSSEAIALLKSIDASLKALVRQFNAPATIASDQDLDGPWGNPQVKFMPRDWNGPSFKGRRMSECPPDLLDLLAQTFDYFARQADEKNEMTDKGKPVADFKRADAARARGWAQRIRSGKHVQTTETASASDTGEMEGWPGDGASNW